MFCAAHQKEMQDSRPKELTVQIVERHQIGRHKHCHHWGEVAYLMDETRRHLHGFIHHQRHMGSVVRILENTGLKLFQNSKTVEIFQVEKQTA